MTFFSCDDPHCDELTERIRLRIRPREKDLGEFTVRRVLPAREQRMVGPFVFFDHMGPAEFPPGKGIDVRPHPHIGIATITYLFEGEILHRDSLGVVQAIQPGAINLMTAGRGIVHSERPGDDYHEHSRLHGIQSWIALPRQDQEMEPAFAHYPADQLPAWQADGVSLRLILGEFDGRTSPVTSYSRTLYVDLEFAADACYSLPVGEDEQALYVAEGELQVGEECVAAGEMVVLLKGEALPLRATRKSRVLLIGGASLGERHLYWNFVSDSAARIDQAKDDWRSGRFPAVPDDHEWIPLPTEE